MKTNRKIPKCVRPEEFKALIQATPKRDIVARISFLLGYGAGMRVSEIKRCRDEHFRETSIFIPESKYGAERIVPIPKQAEPEGAALYLGLIQNKEDNNLLFNSPPGILKSSWMRVIRRDFNDEYDVAPHYFRHCRLTHMVTRFNYDSHQLVKYAGWTDERPAKHYVHLRTEDLELKML